MFGIKKIEVEIGVKARKIELQERTKRTSEWISQKSLGSLIMTTSELELFRLPVKPEKT